MPRAVAHQEPVTVPGMRPSTSTSPLVSPSEPDTAKARSVVPSRVSRFTTEDRRPPKRASRPEGSSVTLAAVAGFMKLVVNSPNRCAL